LAACIAFLRRSANSFAGMSKFSIFCPHPDDDQSATKKMFNSAGSDPAVGTRPFAFRLIVH
jgi:hypothetical protein